MGDGIGLKSFVGIGFQGATGSASIQTTSVHWIPLVSESITEDIPPLESQSIRSRYDEPGSKQGPRVIGGDLVIEGDAHSLGAFFHAAMGVTTTNSADDSLQYHTAAFTSSAWSNKAPLQPMTLLISRDTGSQFTYFDCCADSLKVSIAHDELLSATLSVIGLGFTTASLETPVYPVAGAGDPMATVNSVQAFGNDCEFNFTLESLEFEHNNNLETRGMLTTDNGPNRIKRSAPATRRWRGRALFENFNATPANGLFERWQDQTAGTGNWSWMYLRSNSEVAYLSSTETQVRKFQLTQSPGQLLVDYELFREVTTDDTFTVSVYSLGFNTYGNGLLVAGDLITNPGSQQGSVT